MFCAWAAKRAKDSYYRAQFFRLQAKRGPQKAICAVAASILTAISTATTCMIVGRNGDCRGDDDCPRPVEMEESGIAAS